MRFLQTHAEKNVQYRLSARAFSPSTEPVSRHVAAHASSASTPGWPSGRAAGRVGELWEVGPPLAVHTLHVVVCGQAGDTAQTGGWMSGETEAGPEGSDPGDPTPPGHRQGDNSPPTLITTLQRRPSH